MGGFSSSLAVEEAALSASPLGPLHRATHNISAGFIRAIERDSGSKMEISIFHNQISKVTSHHLCLIRLLEASHNALPTLMGKGLQKVWIPGGGDHWGHLGVCLVIFPFLVYGSTTSSVVQAPSGGVLLDSSLSGILSTRHSNLAPDDLSDLTSFLCRVLAFLLFWEAQSHLRAFCSCCALSLEFSSLRYGHGFSFSISHQPAIQVSAGAAVSSEAWIR